MFRKIIRITAEDSPNVALALAEIRAGRDPSGRVLVPGILGWDEYQLRRREWSAIRQCVGLDAKFYEGVEILLYPPEVLARAEQLALRLKGKTRYPKAIGVDPGEGGDSTCWVVVDELGVIELLALKTADTSTITGTTLGMMKRHGLTGDKVAFDRGGGGKQHADRLRTDGHEVRTVAFGEPVMAELRTGLRTLTERREIKEERTTYKNRRAQMADALAILLSSEEGFAVPAEYTELHRQLAPVPRTYDDRGVLYLLPKHSAGKNEPTLIGLLGHSPDEYDALLLAVHCMQTQARPRPTVAAYTFQGAS